MEYSKYQLAIFKAISETNDNLVIDAVAGSGKTTTIVESLKLVTGKVLFVAFNKHIATELANRVPSNVQATTLNAFGWRTCLKNLGKLELVADKTDRLLKETVDRDTYYKIKGAIARLISLFKANVIVNINEQKIIDLANKQGIELPFDPGSEKWSLFVETIIKVYTKSISLKTILDFDDQVFYPILFNLPIENYDLIMVDESQDLNPIQIELIIRAAKRIIAVGDTRQAIYGFRGADPEAIANLIVRVNAKVLPLSICYRCPKTVVAEAKKIVPHIEPSEFAKEGTVTSIKKIDFEKQVTNYDWVLCRVTAPLVSGCLKMIRNGRKATVKGRDIGQQIITLVEKISTNKQESIATFNGKLQSYYLKQLARLEAADREAEIMVLNDKVDTIKVILESCDIVLDIHNKIMEIFSDQAGSGITFCTVHKSKGLEAKNIFILEPQLLPHPMAKKEWQKIQEMNLKYVAITRSLENLLWVGK